jgi:hypothetical protein
MRNWILIALLVTILSGCGGGGKKNEPEPPSPPAKTVLTAPFQNGICITGTVISGTQSSVTFMWNAAKNTDVYELVIKNLLTSTTSSQSTNKTQLAVTLLRNTPYSWYVVSISGQVNTTAQSDIWKFYNSGPGVVVYTPYPAEITAPVYGQQVNAGTVNLTWTGSAVEGATITGYDVYFGATSTPDLFKNNLTESFVNSVAVTSGKTYYWRVVTKDENGNSSDSGLYQFSVK